MSTYDTVEPDVMLFVCDECEDHETRDIASRPLGEWPLPNVGDMVWTGGRRHEVVEISHHPHPEESEYLAHVKVHLNPFDP